MKPERLLELYHNSPISRLMDGRVEFLPDGAAVVILPARDEFTQATGIVHASVITFAADTSAYFTAAASVGDDELVITSGFTLNLVRPADPAGGLRAISSLVKRGKTLVIVRAQVTDDAGTLIAEGIWTHVVVTPTRAPNPLQTDRLTEARQC